MMASKKAGGSAMLDIVACHGEEAGEVQSIAVVSA